MKYDTATDESLKRLTKPELLAELLRVRRVLRDVRNWRKAAQLEKKSNKRLRKSLAAKHVQLKSQAKLLKEYGHVHVYGH